MSNTENTKKLFSKHAVLYEEKYMNINLYKDSFDLFCQKINKNNAEIQEIGCGPGNITRYLLNQNPGYNILGFDLSSEMIRLAKKNNPEAEFIVMDCREILSINKKYDAVMCGFCLPYLSKEETKKLIHDVSLILHPGGIFYLSTMEGEYSQSGIQKSSTGDELYIYYHQEDYLTVSLNENNFSIIDLRRKVYQPANKPLTTDLLIIAQKSR
jgi:ubiquinone/menaquinone biosynthesis C-methylase UbiE